MTTYYVESMVCRSFGEDCGDWWVVGDVLPGVPDQLPDIHIGMIKARLRACAFEGLVGVFPYAINEYEEENWE